MTQVEVDYGRGAVLIGVISILLMVVLAIVMVVSIAGSARNSFTAIIGSVAAMSVVAAGMVITVKTTRNASPYGADQTPLVTALMANALTRSETKSALPKILDLRRGEHILIFDRVFVVRGDNHVFFVGEKSE